MAKSLYRTENLELAALLREVREAEGLVQTALGERMGRGQTYVSNVELGIRRLDVVELRDYCSALGIELRDLVARWESRITRSTVTKNRGRKR